jgi:hypothetical protein
MKNLIEKAELKIQEEIKRVGFIDDSDNTDRFLDNLSQELTKEEILKGNEDIIFHYDKESEIEELQEKLLEEIKYKIMNKYNHFSTCEGDGHYKSCYYEIDKEFNNWDEFNDHFGRCL